LRLTSFLNNFPYRESLTVIVPTELAAISNKKSQENFRKKQYYFFRIDEIFDREQYSFKDTITINGQ
tara:strand:+ start:62 stop:262 length:201 start_codon:yes stop_codon:yes gene_type:complete